MPCFGGPDLKMLFVNSLTPDGSDAAADGGLYCVDVDVAGLPPHRFARIKSG